MTTILSDVPILFDTPFAPPPLFKADQIRLGARLGQTAEEVNAIVAIVTNVLAAYCATQGVTVQQCNTYKAKLDLCKNQLSQALSTGDLGVLTAAGICIANLKKEIDEALDKAKAQPPPVQPPIQQQPPPPAQTPGWVVPTIAVGSVVIVGGLVWALFFR